MTFRRVVAAAVAAQLLFLLPSPGKTAEIKAIVDSELAPAYQSLVPQFEKITGVTVKTTIEPGVTPDKLATGEEADVVIGPVTSVMDLIKQGKVMGDTRADLARSQVGIAVRSGTAAPDIGTANALKNALVAAGSISYPATPEGTALAADLFKRLGIADAVKDKARPATNAGVAATLARGEADIGLDYANALTAVPGIDYVGRLPARLQHAPLLVAGVATKSKEQDAAEALIKFLSAPIAFPTMIASGSIPADMEAR